MSFCPLAPFSRKNLNSLIQVVRIIMINFVADFEFDKSVEMLYQKSNLPIILCIKSCHKIDGSKFDV